jgi:hypothetical protein
MHFGTKSYLKSNRYHTAKHHFIQEEIREGCDPHFIQEEIREDCDPRNNPILAPNKAYKASMTTLLESLPTVSGTPLNNPKI